MKKIIAFVLVTSLVLGIALSGCGQSGKVAAETGKTSAAESTGTGTDTGTGKLTIMSWENETAMKPVLDGFKKKNPDISVDFQFVPPVKDYVEKLKVNLSTDTAADIFVIALENKNDIMSGGYAMDISDQPFTSVLSKFNKDIYSKDGKLYAFSQSAWAGGIFYNKKLFEKVGVQVPKTWDEFIKVCGTLKKAGIVPYLENFQDSAANIVTGLFITETYHKIENYDNDVNSGTKKYVDGWTVPAQLWYKDLVKTGYMTKDMLGISWDQQQAEFATEKVAMSSGGPWCIPIFKKANPNLQFGLMPYPGTEKAHWAGSPGIAYCVNAKAKNKQSALKLLEYMATPDGLKEYSTGTGQMISATGVKCDIYPELKEAQQGLLDNDIWNPMAGWKYPEAIRNQFMVSVQDCFAGAVKPEQIAKDMDAKFAEMENK